VAKDACGGLTMNDKGKAFWVKDPDEGLRTIQEKPFVFNMTDEDSERTDEAYRTLKVILDRLPDILSYGERRTNKG
jgi:hypothetical protein